MSRCWGITKSFRRCGINAGEKWLCHKHATQPRYFMGVAITTIVLSYIAMLLPNPFKVKHDLPPVTLSQFSEIFNQTSEFEKQSQKKPLMDIIPDVTKAKREVLIVSDNQLKPRSNLYDVSTNVPGYFEFTASPASSKYSHSCVDTKDIL